MGGRHPRDPQQPIQSQREEGSMGGWGLWGPGTQRSFPVKTKKGLKGVCMCAHVCGVKAP